MRPVETYVGAERRDVRSVAECGDREGALDDEANLGGGLPQGPAACRKAAALVVGVATRRADRLTRRAQIRNDVIGADAAQRVAAIRSGAAGVEASEEQDLIIARAPVDARWSFVLEVDLGVFSV